MGLSWIIRQKYSDYVCHFKCHYDETIVNILYMTIWIMAESDQKEDIIYVGKVAWLWLKTSDPHLRNLTFPP